MTELVKYEAACRAVADAVSIDEAKDFRDKSEAMRAYAKQAKNKQLEVQAAEIRIRAERRIGELMAAQRDAGMLSAGTAGTGNANVTGGLRENPPVGERPITLAEAGIDKNLADRARKYAAIPEDEFNGIVGDWKGRVEKENERVTVNLLAAGDRAAEKAKPVEQEHDPNAKARKELAKLTREALEDDVIGLRQALKEAKAKASDLKAENDKLKEQLRCHTGDKDEAIRRLTKAIEHKSSEVFRANEKFAEEKRKNYALSKRVKELEAMEIQL